MEIYEVINGPAIIPAGTVLQLSDVQVETRQHRLKRLEKDWYEVQEAIHFKNGEVITFREMPDKTLLQAFITPEQMAAINTHKRHDKHASKPKKAN